MTTDALWTVAICILCNVSCALIGCVLVLRRMGMLGDAISHSILPGVVLAYLLAGRIYPPLTLGCAAILGIITAWMTERLRSMGRVTEDASLGIVFTTLFALGVVLINRYARNVDLDPGCVLFGSLEWASLDLVEVYLPGLGGLGHVPRSAVVLTYGLALVLIVLTALWKEFKMASFDAGLTQSLGFSPVGIHYILVALTAMVVVASFEAVGSVLVVTMLIAPAATSRLLTSDYLRYFLVAALMGAISAVLGYFLSVAFNVSEAGMIALSAAGLFTCALCFSPRRGLVSHWIRQMRFAYQVATQDILGRLYRAEETNSPLGPVPFRERLVLHLLKGTGDVDCVSGSWKLTNPGRKKARLVVRAHRLWEAFLDRHFALPSDHLHGPAHRLEHFLEPAVLQELEAELDRPLFDPHGRTIPKDQSDVGFPGSKPS
jgi:ABC-type Mn2+/Zn2+ transport system permease subunit